MFANRFTSVLQSAVALGIAGSATLLIIAGSAAPVRAETVTVTVATGGIDLNAASGRALVAGQVRIAATRVCGSAGNQDWKIARSVRACTRAAIDGATPQIDALARKARTAALAAAPGTNG